MNYSISHQMVCPHCRKANSIRISRGILKWLLFGLPLKRYHCVSCGNKYVRYSSN